MFCKTHSEETKKRHSEVMKKMYKDRPEMIEFQRNNSKATHNRPGVKEAKSRAMKNLFRDKEFRKKYNNGLAQHPNRDEQYILDLLEKHFPGEWQFNGWSNKQFKEHPDRVMICRKFPDFIHKTERKCIDFFGGYHCKMIKGDWREEEVEKTILFKKAGWSLLVIQYEMLKDEKKVLEKIKSWLGGQIND